ncbi:MAG: hypothetical protein HY704_10545 [Gemmatimonadetes bacterium]|nr:hypothetical protein [Gemmatimonadota bacterium]
MRISVVRGLPFLLLVVFYLLVMLLALALARKLPSFLRGEGACVRGKADVAPRPRPGGAAARERVWTE